METACRRLKEVVGALVAKRKADPPNSPNDNKGSQGVVKALAADGLLHLLHVKDGNKKLCYRAEELRGETNQCRTQLEQAHLQLQNLLYEKQYYEKEIRACRSYQSAFSDAQLGLASEEEFWQQASEECKRQASAGPHQLMLQRLAFEMQHRKHTVKEVEQLKSAKLSLIGQVTSQQKVLSDLQNQLKKLEETAQPLQATLAPHLTLKGFSRTAELLPLPLYIIYSQLVAAKEALGLAINVGISGQVVEAELFAKSLSAEAADTAATTAAQCVASTSGPDVSKRARMSPPPPTFSADEAYKVNMRRGGQ